LSRTPATVRQADIARVLRATIAAGANVDRVEIDRTGKIVIIMVQPTSIVSGASTDEYPPKPIVL
jgi:hypothetical protein